MPDPKAEVLRVASAVRDLLEEETWLHAVGVPVRMEVASASAPAPGPAPAPARSHPLTLAEIRADLGDCTRCKLHTTRTKLVFGVGNPNAEIMFVGEGPGRDEDLQGEPFVGAAGQLLTKIIQAMGFERRDVYIANVVKCRPPQNRDPEPDETGTCAPFLFAQIAAISPKLIVTLGKWAAWTLLETETSISRLRGKVARFREIPLVPTYHPAYLLRNPSAKKLVWDDMKAALTLLGRTPPRP
ncbi:MAG: uracil-DNA glycosylase [Deltaproteobacteria bacterium]|nr:uracil-DNA glycosylase [Deltaproteobacteria bacterium]